MLNGHSDGAERRSKETGAAKVRRSAQGKAARVSSRAREFWRVLSALALSSPHTRSLRRHD